jgi:hypothetical protein
VVLTDEEERKIERDHRVRLKALDKIANGKDTGTALTSDQCRVLDYTFRSLTSHILQQQVDLQRYAQVYGELPGGAE